MPETPRQRVYRSVTERRAQRENTTDGSVTFSAKEMTAVRILATKDNIKWDLYDGWTAEERRAFLSKLL